MTRKELAERIWDLRFENEFVSNRPNGCGKSVWVHRMLTGVGYVQPARKNELIAELDYLEQLIKIKGRKER